MTEHMNVITFKKFAFKKFKVMTWGTLLPFSTLVECEFMDFQSWDRVIRAVVLIMQDSQV